MATISEALAIALQHQRAGRLDLAKQVCGAILAVEPDQPDAFHLLGIIAQQAEQIQLAAEYLARAIEQRGDDATWHRDLGRAYGVLGNRDDALECYQRAVQLQPGSAAAHDDLGVALAGAAKTDEAIACFRRAMELDPHYAEAYYNLGNTLREQGKPSEAVACFRRVLEIKPDYAQAHAKLGTALRDLHKLDDAVVCFRRALEITPDYVEAHDHLGTALRSLGKLDEAAACFRRAVELNPDYVEAQNNLGSVLRDQGKREEAVACFRRVLDPHFATVHYNEGVALMKQGKPDDAIVCFRRALELKPDHAEAHNNIGSILQERGQLSEATACYRRAISAKPDYAEAHNNLGNAARDLGNLHEAAASYRRALELAPDLVVPRSNMLYTRQYQSDVTLAALAEAHQEYQQQHAAPLRSLRRRHTHDRTPHRRLRLGFVSPDFAIHPVGFFLLPVLENLDPTQCETFAYHNRRDRDLTTAQIQAAVSTWRDVYGVADGQVAKQIHDDQIDVLFDLAGHTARNRLLVFARMPAPIQITWMGYVGTTGLEAMDYILADRYEIPPEAEPYYCEKVLRMPDDYICYAPPAHAPWPAPLPAIAAGRITFASFNNPTKITRDTVALWSRCPASRSAFTACAAVSRLG